jgi:hypothetical protein
MEDNQRQFETLPVRQYNFKPIIEAGLYSIID